MKTITIAASGDEPVILQMIDPASGNPVVETSIAPGEAHLFVIEDGMLVQPIDQLTPAPVETF